MRVLHVAALPFPTFQGTQALLLQMLSALHAQGREHELLTYAHAGYAASLPFPLHRARELFPYRSLRSGPSARKLLSDAALAVTLRRVLGRRSPAVLVAHHVEAAALLRGGTPWVFFAHTDLGAELPSYAKAAAKAALGGVLGTLGELVDEQLLRRADAVASFCPALVSALRTRAKGRADKVRYVPAPWPLQRLAGSGDRLGAREQLGLPAQAQVLLYAGNLDGYQGWEQCLRAVARLQRDLPEVVLLVGTESDPRALLAAAQRAGIARRVRVASLAGEAARHTLHAAADLALITRRTPGGLPIKLLDALARGVCCVVTPTATGGLALDRAAELSAADDGEAIAASVVGVLAGPARRQALGEAARRYVAHEHDPARFCDALDGVCSLAWQTRLGPSAAAPAGPQGDRDNPLQTQVF